MLQQAASKTGHWISTKICCDVAHFDRADQAGFCASSTIVSKRLNSSPISRPWDSIFFRFWSSLSPGECCEMLVKPIDLRSADNVATSYTKWWPQLSKKLLITNCGA